MSFAAICSYHAGRFPALIAVVYFAVALGGCGNVPVRTMDLPTLVRDVEMKAYLVQRFRAQFVQTRRTEIFNRNLSVRGSLVFEKPNRFHLALAGDVNVEILSDGRHITMFHDGKDRETFRLHGDRDFSKFADPLMVLLQSMGNGGLRKFSVVRSLGDDNSVTLEAVPTGQMYFERTKKVALRFSDSGELERVALDFGDGNRDETVFRSWTMLAQDDPEIVQLNKRLQAVSQAPPAQPGAATHLASSNPGATPSTQRHNEPILRFLKDSRQLFSGK